MMTMRMLLFPRLGIPLVVSLLIMVVVLGHLVAGTFTVEPDDQCVAAGHSVQFMCEATDTSRALYWILLDLDKTVAYNHVASMGYNVLFEDRGSSRKSTLTVLSVTKAMKGDKYYCRVGSSRTKEATLTVTECSWCNDVENSGIKQYVTVNSRAVPDPCVLKAGTLNFKLNLSSSPQEFGVSVTITLNGEDITGASETMTYDCATIYSPLTISGISLGGGQLTAKLMINHPNLASTEFYPINNCIVSAPPESTNIGRANPYIVIEGEDAEITCKASAGYPENYQYRYRAPTNLWSGWDSADKKTYTRRDKTMSGQYSCQSKTTGGDGPTSALAMKVHYKPGPATPDHRVLKVTEQMAVTLKCSLSDSGEPKANFAWTKIGEANKRKTNDFIGEYTIISVDFDKDDGKYECVPGNVVGIGDAGTITVEVQTIPTVEVHPTKTTVVNTARNFEIKCSFQARPGANVAWEYSNGTDDYSHGLFSWSDIKTASGQQNKLTTTESTLTWNAESDPLDRRYSGGQMKCVANNGIGDPVESNQAELVVEYTPDIYRTDPGDLKKGAALGEEVRLSVKAIANPQPDNLFKRQMKKADSSLDMTAVGYVVENTGLSSILIIQNTTKAQFANYSVTATNKHGSANVTFQVTAYDVPDEPTDMNLTVTAVSLTAEWNRGWNGGLSQIFVLKYREGAKEVKVKNVKDLKDERYHSVRLGEDDGVRQSTEYTVTIQATNSKGKSENVSRKNTTKAKPTVNADATTIDHNKDAKEATITLRVSAQSFTLVLVKVCNVKEECTSHNVTDIKEPTAMMVPDGNDLSFSFTFFDGLEQVSVQKDVIKIGPAAKTSDNIAPITGAVVGVIVAFALIAAIPTFFVWRKRRARGNNGEIPNEGSSKARGNILRGKLERFRAASKRKTSAVAEAKIYERTNPTYVNEHMREPEYARLGPGTNSLQQV